MKIEEKSDSDILKIANPMWDEITDACKARDWNRYAQFFTDNDRENPAHKKDIVSQWENNPVLTSITKEKHFLCIIRRENEVVVVWKISSTVVKGEFLGLLQLTTLDAKTKVTGVGLN